MTVKELDSKLCEWVKATGTTMSITQRQQLLSLLGAVCIGGTLAERKRCAEVVKDWHIKKGGYLELAHTIREGPNI